MILFSFIQKSKAQDRVLPKNLFKLYGGKLKISKGLEKKLNLPT